MFRRLARTLAHSSRLGPPVLLTVVGSATGAVDLSAVPIALDLQPAATEASPPEPAAAVESIAPRGEFLFSNERIHGDPEILWPGFIAGLRGFEHFFDPIGNPLYFETPFINTSARLLYLHHEFDGDSQLRGGRVDVYAVQARIAVTERIAIIATKDGWSHLETGILPEAGGWNDIALGLKAAFWVDRENDFIATASFRWQWGNGDKDVLMGGAQELSPGITVAKGFGDLKLMGNFVYRFATDGNKGNDVAQWDAHLAYDLSSVGLKGVAPILELHGLHYITDGTRFPLSVGGLDYTNLGSADVSGSSVVWVGMGARVKFTPNISAGATYEIGLTNHAADIMRDRVTVDVTLTW